MLVTQFCPALCNIMDCSPQDSSVHGILHTRILEWVVISFSRKSSQPRDGTWVSHIAGRFFTVWTTREALISVTKESRRNECWDHWQTWPPFPFVKSSSWLLATTSFWHWCSFLPSWRWSEGILGLCLQSAHPSSISFISSSFSSVDLPQGSDLCSSFLLCTLSLVNPNNSHNFIDYLFAQFSYPEPTLVLSLGLKSPTSHWAFPQAAQPSSAIQYAYSSEAPFLWLGNKFISLSISH